MAAPLRRPTCQAAWGAAIRCSAKFGGRLTFEPKEEQDKAEEPECGAVQVSGLTIDTATSDSPPYSLRSSCDMGNRYQHDPRSVNSET
jgi:hypothetical protein